MINKFAGESGIVVSYVNSLRVNNSNVFYLISYHNTEATNSMAHAKDFSFHTELFFLKKKIEKKKKTFVIQENSRREKDREYG